MENMENFFRGLMVIIGIICLVSLLIGLPLWILWNLVMPDVFGLPHITFWQAVGLNLICSILFKEYRVKTKSE
jgi:Ca2+/H+ antiporter, TMEM165/GDT1 family